MFKVGQKVKLLADIGGCSENPPLVSAGEVGVVINVDDRDWVIWPYLVKFERTEMVVDETDVVEAE